MAFFDRFIQQAALRQWARAARKAGSMDLGSLRRVRTQARVLRTHLDGLIRQADERLALPAIGSKRFPKPADADWSWRPELWRGPIPVPGLAGAKSQTRLGNEVMLFHDCLRNEITLHQLRNMREEDLAPYALRMDVFSFEGSFCSLVLDMSESAIKGLLRDHLIRMDVQVDLERPIEIFARLNIKHGPNTEQLVRELPLGEAEVMVEFDLAYTKLNEKRIEHAWVDLIFDRPEMNQIMIRDVTFSRRLRAGL